MTQNELIKKHLEKGKKITPMQALVNYGCFRLAARINELRKDGLNILTVIKRDEIGRPYAEYLLT